MKKMILCAAAIAFFAACDNKAEREAEIQTATQAAIDSMNAITERERLNDSMNVATGTEATISTAPVPTADEKNIPAKTKKSGGQKAETPATKPGTTKEETG